MIIDYISDLHVDFYMDNDQQNIEYFKKSRFHEIFLNKNGEVLIIAGDIGHFNDQNIFALKTIKELYGYKKIFFVLGNHDYYLLSECVVNEYKENSYNRINEMKKLCDELEDIHILSGDVIEYKGIKFGGSGLWYDGKYLQRFDMTLTKDGINDLWKRKIMDANAIYGINNYDEIFKEEIEKLRQCYDKCDVLITHVNPSILPQHTVRKHLLNKLNGFYSFDGEYYLENTPAKYWIFGHTHTEIEYEVYGTEVLCNPLGYPQENCDFKLKSFEV